MENLLQIPFASLRGRHPAVDDFFSSLRLPLPFPDLTLAAHFAALDSDHLAEAGITREDLPRQLSGYLEFVEKLKRETAGEISSLTVIGGVDKEGRPEDVELTLRPGEVVGIVGPTGSGKSRLLADIEWLAQGDTPTRRRILLDGKAPDPKRRFSVEGKLVAQLSQTMNFVMDLSVEEFVILHAESRLAEDVAGITATVLEQANALAGEPFSPRTPLTALSGGQSRALMIADTAFLSRSPVVLIDEIENAGIDRRRALDLLVGRGKIVLMATHDPLLALMADRRIVIGGGGIRRVLATTGKERGNLARLEELDSRLMRVRQALRGGETIEFDI